MACYHPLEAWRTSGGIQLGKEARDGQPLRLPCGGCIGCRYDKARHWAVRCTLELEQHRRAAFTTLTYDEKTVPATLDRRHLQLWLKRLRKASGPTRPLRFFASGEYGETNHRPHFHAILYGLGEEDDDLINSTWGKGFTYTKDVTPAAIAYVAGYCSKKIGFKAERSERIDPETGEVYTWEPPFVQMSRRPGIGAHAKQWPQSWRQFAIHNGRRVPVPRYLHEAWKAVATADDVAALEYEKQQMGLLRDTTRKRLEAAERVAIARQRRTAEKRAL